MSLQFLRPSETDPERGVYLDTETGEQRTYGLPKALRPKCSATLPDGKPCFRSSATGHTTCRQCSRRALMQPGNSLREAV